MEQDEANEKKTSFLQIFIYLILVFVLGLNSYLIIFIDEKFSTIEDKIKDLSIEIEQSEDITKKDISEIAKLSSQIITEKENNNLVKNCSSSFCNTRIGFIKAAYNIHEILNKGGVFKEEAQFLKKVKVQDPTVRSYIEELVDISNTGIKSKIEIKNQFTYELQDEIVKLYNVDEQDSELRKKIFEFLGDAIVIKKIGKNAEKDNGIHKELFNVRLALRNDDLHDAVEIVAALDFAKDLTEKWISDAKLVSRVEELTHEILSYSFSKDYRHTENIIE